MQILRHIVIRVAPLCHSQRPSLLSSISVDTRTFDNHPCALRLCCRNRWVSTAAGDSVWSLLSTSSTVQCVQSALCQVHDFSGLPWWATIAATTILVRSCVALPLYVYQQHVIARYVNLKPQLDQIAVQIRDEVAMAKRTHNWEPDHCRKMFFKTLNEQKSELVVENNCHPAKAAIINIIPLPVWLSMSVALRNLSIAWPPNQCVCVLVSAVNQMNLSVEGTLWFPDLLQPDSLYLLPLTVALLNICCLELGLTFRMEPVIGISKIPVYLGRALCLTVFAISCYIPTSLVLFWTVSSLHALLTHLLLMAPRVRRLLRIPLTPQEISSPYRQLWRGLLRRLTRSKHNHT